MRGLRLIYSAMIPAAIATDYFWRVEYEKQFFCWSCLQVIFSDPIFPEGSAYCSVLKLKMRCLIRVHTP